MTPPETTTKAPRTEALWNVPNAVTLARTALGLGVFSAAAVAQDPLLNFVGLVLYWALDALDGFLARVLDQETRLGAQMDILADRLLMGFFLLNHLTFQPGSVVPVALLFFEFMGLDHYLSNQFLRWPLLSPNYFHSVDRTLWRLNWSAPAKVLNASLVALLLLATSSPWPPLVALVPILAVKVYSFARLRALPPPEPWLGRAAPFTPELGLVVGAAICNLSRPEEGGTPHG